MTIRTALHTQAQSYGIVINYMLSWPWADPQGCTRPASWIFKFLLVIGLLHRDFSKKGSTQVPSYVTDSQQDSSSFYHWADLLLGELISLLEKEQPREILIVQKTTQTAEPVQPEHPWPKAAYQSSYPINTEAEPSKPKGKCFTKEEPEWASTTKKSNIRKLERSWYGKTGLIRFQQFAANCSHTIFECRRLSTFETMCSMYHSLTSC